MKELKNQGWKFVGDRGDFELQNPHKTSYLYFPLANEAGLMSSITPTLHGDSKTSQNTFAIAPVSVEDLHNTKSSRNFWVIIDDNAVWSATGNSSQQIANTFINESEESVNLACGLLWHKVYRENRRYGIKSEITSFVPVTEDKVELTKVVITNTGSSPLKITPTAAIPIYGRSAENLRDHRHVTSLLHRIVTVPDGIEVKPSMSFDERGHKVNNTIYFVYGTEEEGKSPVGFFPVTEEFIGEGGCLEWPEAVVKNLDSACKSGTYLEGYEAIGALRFSDAELAPGEAKAYVLAVGIGDTGTAGISEKYFRKSAFDRYLEENKEFWQKKTESPVFRAGNRDFDMWMKWVTLQPILRRIYGCSFLPHHDYGRGGRGWRDLWQDCLALLIMEPEDVKNLLHNNYGGVRIDGSNATIIGSKPGEFIADRNNISRVWMDHGAWPFLTTQLYINQSGDLDFLLQEQSYFKDRQIKRSRGIDSEWTPEYGNRLKTHKGEIYRGTILEHMLLQNLVQFYNVGEHNNIKLEDADWNDALDMAHGKGESVAFTAFYAYNLNEIGNILLELKDRKGLRDIIVSKEIAMLFDSIEGKIDYNSVSAKLDILDRFYNACSHSVSGDKISVGIEKAAADLKEKAAWIIEHIRKNEWIKNFEGSEWFNGYYDNAGKRVEGDFPSGVRMTLTGQVFTIMGCVADDEQVGKISKAVRKHLKDKQVGYRLNSDFKELKLDLGRCFGFAFGHKENGAMFSHMTIMYANALYKRGFVKEGYDVISSIYGLCSDFGNSRIYPGIPEYINEKRRGMYHYLTGSASWLLLTVLNEIFGVKGRLGDLQIEPKLVKAQFDEKGEAAVTTLFAGREIEVRYENHGLKDYGEYAIKGIRLDNNEVGAIDESGYAVISRKTIEALCKGKVHIISVELA